MISVLILTKNEEINISSCLESVSWSNDIVVLDDGSTDNTVELAQKAGARVICHSAGGEREQRAYSLTSIDFKNDWVYNPDADEVTPPDLRDEMLGLVNSMDNPRVAYRVRYKNMFMGKWIKHSSLYPTWVMRLFRPDKISFARDINLTYRVDGEEGRLTTHFEHHSFNKGLTEWFAKHNRYSSIEAVEALREVDYPIKWSDLFRDPVSRRKALKQLAWRVPLRSAVVFLYMYLIRLGFLDGTAGFRYCLLRASYEYMIDVKIKELKRREKGLPI